MATVGDQLLQPEAGWRRFDDSNGGIRYTGTWIDASDSNCYSGSIKYSNIQNVKAYFEFEGTKIRIIDQRNTNRNTNITISIDGIKYNYSSNGSSQYQTLVFEHSGLPNVRHQVHIENTGATGRIALDAIDIDASGELKSIPPATTGKLCNSLDEMQIGDYIVWKYDATKGYQFGGTTEGYTEIPVTGVPFASMPPTYFMYFIKVDKGLLISDRVFYHTRSWDSLNSARTVQGFPTTITGVSGVIRSLTGGIAYADEDGNLSLTYKGEYGAFPSNNEWDRYIRNFPSQLIQSEKTLNDIWNAYGILTWTGNTPTNGLSFPDNTSGMGRNNRRIIRQLVDVYGLYANGSNSIDKTYGFRPVFEYKEV